MTRLFTPFPALSITTLILIFAALVGNAAAASRNTAIIEAVITDIQPIYMNYTVEKVITPCVSNPQGCWNVSYQKKAAKTLEGYRIKLSYNGNTFTARMQKKPSKGHLNIRVKSDLLAAPSTVAINAMVVY
ncbi:hypothetical protein [Candidatus Thioglobus sp.]|uniref:hypothetical protein n=1 Tax=Candidatus Thioglobus sp. TaxID=2026721 RepID=UPI003D0E480B